MNEPRVETDMGGVIISWESIFLPFIIPILLFLTSIIMFIISLKNKKLKKDFFLGIAILHFIIFIYFFIFFLIILTNFYSGSSPSYPCLIIGIPFFIIGIIFTIQYQALVRKEKLDTKKIKVI